MKTITLKNGIKVPVYFDDDNPSDVDDIRVVFGPEPFCEHCLDLEPYDMVIYGDGTGWCESCMSCAGESILSLVSEDKSAMVCLKLWEKQEKTKYFNGRLRGLGEDPIDSNGEWDGPDEPEDDEDPYTEQHVSLLEEPDLETRLEELENTLTDLDQRLKKIESFLREKDMHDRPDVLTLDGPPRWDD